MFKKRLCLPRHFGSTLKGKNLFFTEQILFFRVGPFSDTAWYTGKQTRIHKYCLSLEKWEQIFQVNTFPFKTVYGRALIFGLLFSRLTVIYLRFH